MSEANPRGLMRVALQGQISPPAIEMRVPLISEAAEIGALMHAAYLDTIDYEGESLADAVREVQKTFAGEYGDFNRECSRLLEQEGELAAAVLLTRWQGSPFVAFTMTHPRFKRTGLARACMAGAMQALFAGGETELRLLVTLANAPAVRLYRSLGFAFEPWGSAGGEH